MHFNKLLLTFAATALLSSSFSAASLLVGGQFTGGGNGGGTPLQPADTAGVISQANWNVLPGQSGSVSNLVDSSGSGTGICHGRRMTPGPRELRRMPLEIPRTPNSSVARTKTRSTATYTISNLPAGTYNVILYTVNDVENVGSISSGTQTVYDDDQTGGEWNANPVYVRSTANTASAAAAQGPTNYVELTGLSPTNGTITITHSFAQRVGSDTVSINGFQLVQVPEPASIGLIGLGIVGLFARRRV